MITLDSKFLDKVWAKWVLETDTIDPAYRRLYQLQYNRVSRHTTSALRFEEMLLTEGAVIQRINKKCYLQFGDPEDALAFKLKNI